MVARICLVSGGTGGHLWPALVLARALRDAGHECVLMTGGRAVEREVLDRVGCEADVLPVDGRGVRSAMGLANGALRARRLLRERHVEAVICTGGRTSVAVGLAARSLGLPLCLLEQNAVTGRGNRLLARFACRVYHGLPGSEDLERSDRSRNGREVLTGTPLRSEFHRLDRESARRDLDLALDVPVVVVTGGSQGARFLNMTAPDVLIGLRRPLQVVHLAGSGNDEAVRRRYSRGIERGMQAIVREMAVDMPSLYAAADLVICRGGGCTVAELIAAGRAAVIVPYPHHRDRQQWHNGRVLESAGAAVLVEEQTHAGAVLASVVRGLFADPDRLRVMGEAAHGLGRGDACAIILDDLNRNVLN